MNKTAVESMGSGVKAHFYNYMCHHYYSYKYDNISQSGLDLNQ